MTAFIITALIAVLFIIWNVALPFYKDEGKDKLGSDERKCFSQKCRSIIIENGNKRCVLFIHGFPTAPNMYSYPAKVFSENGYDVHAPLIPTFGADWHDFENTTFSQWFSFIDDYYVSLKKRYEKLFVVGVSMGGEMTLKLAEKYSGTANEMSAIAVLAAPVVYNSLIRYGIITSFPTYFARTLGLFRKSIGAKAVCGHEGSQDGDEEWTGYSGLFIGPGLSLVYSMKDVRKNLFRITVPMISIHDKGDKTVPFKNQKIILDHVKSRRLEAKSPSMPYYGHTKHSLLMYDSTKREYTKDILDFFSKEE